jgi:selenide,water dikinase
LAPGALAQVLRGLPERPRDPNLLVGADTADDAGVYRVRADLALVQTVDFFPPLVDDAYTYGRIAAANALSDVYAMNGRPITALNVVGFPDDELPLSILDEILRGASERVAAAGVVTVGGHTVRDKEIKFGLAVTGLIDPADLVTNAGARPGDILFLTKPLGTGFVTTAAKREECPAELLAVAVERMVSLNAIGRDAAEAAGGASAMTDITGFGLAGHAAEVAEASNVTLEIELAALPRFPGVESLAVPRYYTRASKTNRENLDGRMTIAPETDALGLELVFDAQTSGGLLIAIAQDRAPRLVLELTALGALSAARVGRVVKRVGPIAVVFR